MMCRVYSVLWRFAAGRYNPRVGNHRLLDHAAWSRGHQITLRDRRYWLRGIVALRYTNCLAA
jgi:hypothetical protein